MSSVFVTKVLDWRNSQSYFFLEQLLTASAVSPAGLENPNMVVRGGKEEVRAPQLLSWACSTAWDKRKKLEEPKVGNRVAQPFADRNRQRHNAGTQALRTSYTHRHPHHLSNGQWEGELPSGPIEAQKCLLWGQQ